MKSIIKPITIVLYISLFVFLSCKKEDESLRYSIDLSGEWQFGIDKENVGINQEWFKKELSDEISLPGTMDIASKGEKNNEITTSHLNRIYKYSGPAWYRKEVKIPEEWKNKNIQLFLERTKPSTIWIDGEPVGESLLLETPQVYDLTPYLTPGNHLIAIRIDNSLSQTPYGNVHIYSDDTQTNWNGIIGRISLDATSKTFIKDIQVFPDVKNKKISVKVKIGNPIKSEKVDILLSISKKRGSVHVKLPPVSKRVICDSAMIFDYDLTSNTHLWDEYKKSLYDLTVVIKNESLTANDSKTVTFGMRDFSVKGSQFSINDRITFLRGKNDACVFPLTGHVPMDEKTWLNVMGIAKEYGINHYRFHSWCPPEAAFAAADQLGIYLQVELPFWGGLENDTVAGQLFAEGISILKNYANHPSFVMFSMGNEIWGNLDKVTLLMTKLKSIDGRPLYTHGSNNNIGYSVPTENMDFFLAARTPSSGDNTMTHTRMTHAFADSREGGLLNSRFPSTTFNFDYPVSQINIPLISHEIGQYQTYPDFSEIKKYTGVLKASNLEVFQKRLEASGMSKQNLDFQKASGALSAICYRAEIEAALRTKGTAGFQLLDLQDFPGQGTALVGILDAFMDSKNIIDKEEWVQFNNDVVPLLIFKKYCWTNNEKFYADLEVANYSDRDLKNNLKWNITDEKGNKLKEGSIKNTEILNEGLSKHGSIAYNLGNIKKATKINVNISIDSTKYKNSYPIWVYPQNDSLIVPSNLQISGLLNKALLIHLEKGGKALLMPGISSVYFNSFPGMFISDFWNFGMFKGISQSSGMPVSPGTLGLLMDPKHQLFASFPTEFHSNWQWWSIVKNSNSLVLDLLDKDYLPIVQVIDNMERNHKLGMIFEFKVGKGKLLVCMSRLTENLDKPECLQLYKSILKYMNTEEFNPKTKISPELLKQLIRYTITKY